MFRLLEKPRSNLLTWDKFAVADVQQPNFATRIAYYDVPLGFLVELEKNKPVRAYIKAKFEEPVTVNANANIAVNLAGNGHTMLRSTRAASAFPTDSHPDVVAYISSNGGTTWTKATIANANFLSGVVTVNKTPTTDRVKVYFLPGLGEIQFFGYRPAGSDVAGGKVFGKPFRDLHETDQANDRNSMQLTTSSNVLLPSQFRLAVEVRSPSIVEWSAAAEHDLMLPTKSVPIEISDIQALNVSAERMLRGGNF
jgi:hypothetical protein